MVIIALVFFVFHSHNYYSPLDVAKVVFDRCCKKDKPPDHPEHEITFNFEFLDDFDV